MAAMTVNEQTILAELHQVPAEHWGEVLRFIRTLQPSGPGRARERTTPLTAADLLQSGLVGLWADRKDLGDSQAFARHLREQAQTRRRDT